MPVIIQWNCRGMPSKWGDMKQFLSVLTPILIALQETWLLPTDSSDYGLTNYSLYRQDDTTGGRRRGGVALYVCNDFVHSQINVNTALQAMSARFGYTAVTLIFALYYISHLTQMMLCCILAFDSSFPNSETHMSSWVILMPTVRHGQVSLLTLIAGDRSLKTL